MIKSATFLIALATGMISPKASPAAAQSLNSADEHAVLHVENTFLMARVTGDAAALRSTFASDGIFIHNNGDERTSTGLEADVAQSSHWLAFDRSEGTATFYRDTAITHAVLGIHLGGGQIDKVRTTGVYINAAGQWRLVSWQTTPLLASAAPPAKL